MIWAEKLAKGMHWLVKSIKKMTKLLQFAIQIGKYNLIGSHTTLFCPFASHRKAKLNPVHHKKQKKQKPISD